MSQAGREAVLRLVEAAPVVSSPSRRKRGGPPSAGGGDGIDMAIVAKCAQYEQSDTENGKRLQEHYGQDIAFLARAGISGGDAICWTGKYWDQENGAAIAMGLAQQLSPRIRLEVDFIEQTEDEADIIKKADRLSAADQTASARELREPADAAKAKLRGRQLARWKFGVLSGNSSRVKSMLEMAGPDLRKQPGEFNPDPFLVVTQTHTLRFVVEPDLDCPDPDVDRKSARVEASAQFNRADYVTGLIPCDYDPDAKAPKWEKFLSETMRDLDLRRTIQVYSGMGLLGVLAQKLMYHYGLGANGKSVFLAVLAGVIGPSLGVGLPKESIMGNGERGAGQASPDLVRLFGKRMLRVDELKDGEPLREDFVKRLVGGDAMIVRGLYGGYFEFVNVATPHMSGNGRPRIDGTDNGIWRRMLVAHWSYTVPKEQRRDFAEFVGDLLTERSGILNWLIEGACDYLVNGLYEAPSALAATEEYREDMDPVGQFIAQCTQSAPGELVQANQMYRVYEAWARANGLTVFTASRVGRRLKEALTRNDKGATRKYLDVRLTQDALDLLNHAPPLAEPEDR